MAKITLIGCSMVSLLIGGLIAIGLSAHNVKAFTLQAPLRAAQMAAKSDVLTQTLSAHVTKRNSPYRHCINGGEWI